MRRAPLRLLILPLLAAGPWWIQCRPETDDRYRIAPEETDPCADASRAAADGIQDGETLLAVFDCVNQTGLLDSLVPLMHTLANTPASDGSGSLLDLWVDAVRQSRDDRAPPSVQAILSNIERLEVALSDPAASGALQLLGDILAAGVAEPTVALLGNQAEAFMRLKRWNRTRYDSYFPMLADHLCPDLESRGACTGDAELLYEGVRAWLQESGDQAADGTCEPGAGQAIAQSLADTFAPGADDATSEPLVSALAHGLADLGRDPFLSDGLSRIYPEMYGDHPETDYPEPGYELYDTDQSALYSLLSLFSSEEGLAMLEKYFGADVAILTHCYVYNPNAPDGYDAIDRFEQTCAPGQGRFARENPATFGLTQMFRLVKAVDVTFDDRSAAGVLLDLFTDIAGMEYELSGSNNLATVILEFFAQLPKETVIYLVEMAADNPEGIDRFNRVCGTNVQLDDMQALKAAVVDEDVNGGVGLFLELIQAINEASQPEGVGGLGSFKDFLVEWYDTGMWHDLYPYFLNVVVGPPDGSTVDGGDEADGGTTQEESATSLDTFISLAPGGERHDTVTLPFLKTVYGLEGEPMRTLVQPVAAGLEVSGSDLSDLFLALGRLGRTSLDALRSNPETPTGLDCLPALLRPRGLEDEPLDGLTALARQLENPAMLDAAIETLAVPEVRAALTDPGPGGQPSPIQTLSNAIQDGTLEQLLHIVQGLLQTLSPSPAPAQPTTPSGVAGTD